MDKGKRVFPVLWLDIPNRPSCRETIMNLKKRFSPLWGIALEAGGRTNPSREGPCALRSRPILRDWIRSSQVYKIIMSFKISTIPWSRSMPISKSPRNWPSPGTFRTGQDGGKIYFFHLRQGVKFHDGTEFDAAAVKWSIERGFLGMGTQSPTPSWGWDLRANVLFIRRNSLHRYYAWPSDLYHRARLQYVWRRPP